ncbi:hypothetical protein GLOIN_2v1484352 [Rhizophagus clarus]|uniref:Uncharacterized protein n=1 Tax=Rhizophagus clarus TaxID=94130 RepID=A0A8H3M346_9GLOM|nr:hypothetical protein GLOIN_2v1484352 [Rhizophagus clarus]
MKFNPSFIFYFVFVFMATFNFSHAQEIQREKECRIRIYRPKQGSEYRFYSWHYVEYSFNSGCFKGEKDRIDISVIGANGENAYDIVKEGYLETTTRSIRYWIDPSWANDGSSYYVKVTVNKRTSEKSGYFTTFE